MGLFNFVSDLFGTNDAAKAQQNAANENNQLAREQFEYQKEQMSPFLQMGQGALPILSNLTNADGRAQTLADYYNSNEYGMLAEQARRQQLASAEATGNLGSTSTINGLAAIAPQLGNAYLTDRYNQNFGLANIGLSAADSNVASSGNLVSNIMPNNYQIGASQAGQSLSGGQLALNLGGALSGFLF